MCLTGGGRPSMSAWGDELCRIDPLDPGTGGAAAPSSNAV